MHVAVTRSCRIVLALLAALIAPAAARATIDPTVVRHEALGRSVLGGPLNVVELGDPDEARKLLVVGCIHGNEPAGIAVPQRLARGVPPTNADLCVVENLNPDGVSADT